MCEAFSSVLINAIILGIISDELNIDKPILQSMKKKFEYLEPIEHINNFFCLHFFIFQCKASKISLLKKYFSLFQCFNSSQLLCLLESYIENIIIFHESILHNDECLSDQLIELRTLVREIHIELYYELDYCDKNKFIIGNDIMDSAALRAFQNDLRIIHSSTFNKEVSII